jgi:quercetin dioxygenase-like cupin family protein
MDSTGKTYGIPPHGGQPRREVIVSPRSDRGELWHDAVRVTPFAHQRTGATNFSTGLAALEGPGAIPFHKHSCSETMTVLAGEARVLTERGEHRLGAFDCIHIPAGLVHRVESAGAGALAWHWAQATPLPQDELAEPGSGTSSAAATVVRRAEAPMYELAPNTRFYDLFAGRFGSVGICGGYGEFEPGASLPCHFHEYDESITIVTGIATCEVAGARYPGLRGCDTGVVPKWRPHRFLNESAEVMAMIWVYAGTEPERTLVESGYCTGAIPF